ncbi:hypothetical protein QBC47DRAFT_376885 [Echria macrotheca]|uniref:Uncharacterized protein n=1 Tax=Echria macrotheca TaxID=438768 RepID=A0AAJ0BGD3_9PEZI|nr:hypothetical protein QBC47DRAFT_376885 [Echria macrotheca]
MARVQFNPQVSFDPYYPTPRVRIARPRVEIYPAPGTMSAPWVYSNLSPHYDGESKPPEFLICLEMGLLVRSRQLRHSLSTTLREEISARLLQAGIANHISSVRRGGGGNSSESYKDWTVSEDLSVPSQAADHRFGIKLTSPFFRFGPGHASTWLPRFDVVMTVLNQDFEITTHHACGTTVHLVPSRGYWILSEAKRLAVAALYFERCFDALVPPYRRRSVFAKSIRHNGFFSRRRTIPECVDAIAGSQTDSFAALAARMNWCAADSATAEAIGLTAKDFPHATFRWNFTGLNPDPHHPHRGRGTIEFRQPGGVTDAADAVRWTMLVGCFARLSCAFSIRPHVAPGMANLCSWLRDEARVCRFGRGYVADMCTMFSRADAVQYGASAGRDAEVISEDEATRLRWLEMSRCNIGAQKYQDWAKCHPRKRSQRRH